jgi:hypothetical protein
MAEKQNGPQKRDLPIPSADQHVVVKTDSAVAAWADARELLPRGTGAQSLLQQELPAFTFRDACTLAFCFLIGPTAVCALMLLIPLSGSAYDDVGEVSFAFWAWLFYPVYLVWVSFCVWRFFALQVRAR